MEIERKYLLNNLPFDVNSFRRIEIEQAYISTDPVIRIRRADEKYILTVKQSGTIARLEEEFDITKEQYKKLLAKIDGKVIRKFRFEIPIENNLIAELDIYDGYLKGLLTVEVEFETIENANNFIPPNWFGKDISQDASYKNSFLAIFGKP